MASPIEARPATPDIDEEKRRMDERNLAYQRPGGGLFGIESEPRLQADQGTEQYTTSTSNDWGPAADPSTYTGGSTIYDTFSPTNPSWTENTISGSQYPTGYQPPAGDAGVPLDPSTAISRPRPFPEYGDDTLEPPPPPPGYVAPYNPGDPAFGYVLPPDPNPAWRARTQMVAGVPTSMANFRPRLPGQARAQGSRGMGDSRLARMALLRMLEGRRHGLG